MANRRFNTQVAQPRKALAMGGKALKPVDPKKQRGLSKLPKKVRNKMGYMKDGGSVKKPKLGSTDYGVKKLKKGMMDKYQKREKFDKEVDLDKVLKSSKVRRARSEAQGLRKDRIREGIKRRRKEGTGNFKTYKASTEAMGGNVFKDGGRIRKMGGGMSTARKDMMSGYYKNDMGMKGGAMYKDGGKVRRMSQGYKDRKDESIAMRIRKPRTARQLKDSRDESYGKFGSKAKKSGKINR